MNDNQRRIVVAALIVVIAMFLYPPFHFPRGPGVVVNLGYAWLFSPPNNGVGSVNVVQLLTQWLLVAIVAGVLFWLAKTPKE